MHLWWCVLPGWAKMSKSCAITVPKLLQLQRWNSLFLPKHIRGLWNRLYTFREVSKQFLEDFEIDLRCFCSRAEPKCRKIFRNILRVVAITKVKSIFSTKTNFWAAQSTPNFQWIIQTLSGVSEICSVSSSQSKTRFRKLVQLEYKSIAYVKAEFHIFYQNSAVPKH